MAVSIGGLVFWIVALVDCVRRPETVYRVAGTEKVTWVLIVALAGWIGGLVYWFSQRARLEDDRAKRRRGVRPYLRGAASGVRRRSRGGPTGLVPRPAGRPRAPLVGRPDLDRSHVATDRR